MRTIVIIPSRYASVRLPAKPLALIQGRTLIARVCERVGKAEGIDRVLVATDHPEIAAEVERAGAQVIMTSPQCASGTDRVAEAALELGLRDEDVVINVQGDEPLIEPAVIAAMARAFREDPRRQAATPVVRLTDPAQLSDPNIIKVAMSRTGDAIYFSRNAIPFQRDHGLTHEAWVAAYPFYKHVGVYAYRPSVLRTFVALGEGALERAERLEQLRLLEAGIPIHCVEVEYDAVAVDTPQDVLRVEAILRARGEA